MNGFARAIVADEVGLHYGIVEPFQLNCTYQPVYARQGTVLLPVAVTAGMALERMGGALPANTLDRLTPERRAFAQAVCRRLAIRNLVHFDGDGLRPDLIVQLTPEIAKLHGEIDALLSEAVEQQLTPSQICFDLSGLADIGPTAAILNSAGISFSLDLASASDFLAKQEAVARPQLVRIPPAWTRRIAGEADLVRGFRMLVRTLRSTGALIQVEGIETEAQLRAAAAAGADRLLGDFLAPPVRAGTDVDRSPRAFSDLIGAHSNVVPLSA
jgi:EAL domain-containing protein (putative c-di-GMP-specific phosphodiesterase class I)